MRSWLAGLYLSLRGNFFVFPMLLAALALVGASFTIALDETDAGRRFDDWSPLPTIGLEGAKLLLSTIAGSMITVASLVFSLTLVALTLISQQLGPRIVPVFMTDRVTQVVLGSFIASFLYALVLLSSVGSGGTEFVPQIGVYSAVLFAILSFFLMILFLHHIARSMQADAVISVLSTTLHREIDSILSDGTPADDDAPTRIDGRRKAVPVVATQSGYVQYVDYAGAAKACREHDVTVEFLCRPGQFLLNGSDMARLHGANAADNDALVDQLRDTWTIGSKRTPAQQVDYEFTTLLEVALRALSPGVNDPFTAIACMDHLTSALERLANADHHPLRDLDSCGVCRVVRHPQTFEHYMTQILNPLRQACASAPMAMHHLAQSISLLESVCSNREALEIIHTHAGLVAQDCRRCIDNPEDRKNILAELPAKRSRP